MPQLEQLQTVLGELRDEQLLERRLRKEARHAPRELRGEILRLAEMLLQENDPAAAAPTWNACTAPTRSAPMSWPASGSAATSRGSPRRPAASWRPPRTWH